MVYSIRVQGGRRATPAAIQAAADAIALRGIKRIQVGDRSHTFLSPKEIRDDAKSSEADALDATYGGFLNVSLENPT